MVNQDKIGGLQVTLIDFGFADKLLTQSDNNVKEKETNFFRGNLLFSTYNQM